MIQKPRGVNCTSLTACPLAAEEISSPSLQSGTEIQSQQHTGLQTRCRQRGRSSLRQLKSRYFSRKTEASNLAFWPSFPSGLCGRRSRSRPAWPVCVCISAAPPDTPSDPRSDRGKPCRQFLSPAGGTKERLFKKESRQKHKNTVC